MTTSATEPTAKSAVPSEFRAARDLLLATRTDWSSARENFRWPRPKEFNWALEWFDELGRSAEHVEQLALRIMDADGTETCATFSQMTRRSNQVANWLRGLGVRRGDRIVLMLGNQVELWETMLAAMKLGAVVIPATTLLGPDDLAERVVRGAARHVVVRSEDAAKLVVDADVTRIAVGAPVPGWTDYADSAGGDPGFEPDRATRCDETMLLYFTSGTTSRPKLVEHTHTSYPIGSLSTMYWMGLEPGDVHLNISSPGWAKHAWSNLFAPWNAGATVFVYNYERLTASALMEAMGRAQVTSFCAPPTVWRMLIQADLTQLSRPPTKVLGAGEPLNPEVISQVKQAWGTTIRDGFGQTETTAQVGNSPGQTVKPGSMGRPLPGYEVVLVDPATGLVGDTGEICLELEPRPAGLMVGYHGDEAKTAAAMADGRYHTGDVASRDTDGYISYIGRTDDVFKSSDYKISPFELESVLLEHEAVAEAAIVPSPHAIRLSVPKAYVVLAKDFPADESTAQSILDYAREHLAPYKRIRRLEFTDLPKTISGKIRRVELRHREEGLDRSAGTPTGEFGEG